MLKLSIVPMCVGSCVVVGVVSVASGGGAGCGADEPEAVGIVGGVVSVASGVRRGVGVALGVGCCGIALVGKLWKGKG